MPLMKSYQCPFNAFCISLITFSAAALSPADAVGLWFNQFCNAPMKSSAFWLWKAPPTAFPVASSSRTVAAVLEPFHVLSVLCWHPSCDFSPFLFGCFEFLSKN